MTRENGLEQSTQPIDTVPSKATKYEVHIENASGLAIGDGAQVIQHNRSEKEELSDYLNQAVAAFEVRMYRHLAPPATLPDQPYRFLYAFDIEDTDVFFGRDAASRALHETVLNGRLTVLHAKSGAGKTSLLNAGLSPCLIHERRLPVYARAYDDPVRAIKRAIAPPSQGPWPELLPKLSLHEFLGQACERLNRQTQELVIILDQFEEFVIFYPEREHRQPFIDTLADCHNDSALPVRFVIGIRSDFFSQLATMRNSLPHIFHNEYYLGAMTHEEAEAAITEPVRRRGRPIVYAQALRDTLLDDLARGGMELPHLQIICTRLYEALTEDKTVITLAAYEELGHAEGVLGGYLNGVLDRLPDEDARIAREVLKELVSSASTKRVLSRDALVARVEASGDELDSVLAQLVGARLLRRDEVAGEFSYEMVHEYLIREIGKWISQEDLGFKRAQELLEREVASWRTHGWLVEKTALTFIHQHRELLTDMTTEEIELLFRSAVEYQFSVDAWALRAHQEGIDIWPILQPVLHAGDPHVRASVLAVLPVVGKDAIPALGEALTDKVPLVRVQAILALERLDTEHARQILRNKLVHEVYVRSDEGMPGFYIDRYPVTNKEYQAFLQDSPNIERPSHWQSRSAPQHLLDHPVVEVSWYDAQAYATWAGKRLPAAGEWWRAAGGEKGLRYPWGNRFVPGCCNTRESEKNGTTSVHEYSPATDSPYGVGDMAGNVWEWLDEEAGSQHLDRQLRGGAWLYSAEFAQIGYERFWRRPDCRQDIIGFRLCFSIPR